MKFSTLILLGLVVAFTNVYADTNCGTVYVKAVNVGKEDLNSGTIFSFKDENGHWYNVDGNRALKDNSLQGYARFQIVMTALVTGQQVSIASHWHSSCTAPDSFSSITLLSGTSND